MKHSDLAVASHLRRVGERWRNQRAYVLSAGVVAGFAVLAFILGWLIWRGSIIGPWVAALLFLGLLGLGLLGLFWIWLGVFFCNLDRTWLAAESEASNPPLLDRLNTVAHLEAQPLRNPGRIFLDRIRSQAATVLKNSAQLPFPAARACWAWAMALMLLTASSWWNLHYQPWERLKSAAAGLGTAKPETSFELASGLTDQSAQKAPWGEVRITDPGRDLKLTKVDVLELKIEAAANDGLAKVAWSHTVNGEAPQEHRLGAPKEPNYAAYTEGFYLDELKLADWDLVSYYAEASAGGAGTLSSEIYFVEIRPFRSEIAKMPGGEGGKANRMLKEVSGLIERQQQILRQTRRYLGRLEKESKLLEQDRGKLEAAERELKNSTDAMYAEVATTLENQPVGAVLEGLAAGAESMDKAVQALHEDVVPAAQQKELAALQELAATRKMLQKVISDAPDAFDEKQSKSDEDPMEALAEVSEMRKRQKAARADIDRLAVEQKELRKQSKTDANGARTKLAEKQAALKQRLSELEAEHPEVFRGAKEEAKAAEEAMDRAEESLNRNEAVGYRQNRAVDRMEDLQKAISEHDSARSMEEAYRLKQLVEKQSEGMEKAAQGELGQEQTQKLAQAAKETTRELKEVAEKKGSGLGPELGKALSGEGQAELERELGKAGGSSAESKEAAGKAGQGLKKIVEAFDRSVPQAAGKGQAGERETGEDHLTKAMRQMQSLVQRAGDGRPAKPEDEAKQREEALENLKLGLAQYDGDAGKAVLLKEAEQELQAPDRSINMAELKRLLDAIERFRVELSEKRQRAQLQEEMNHSDPTKISPLYRDRVQQYFRQLSEQ